MLKPERPVPPSKRPEYRREYDARRAQDPVAAQLTADTKLAWARNRDPASRAVQHLRGTYGLTLEDYDKMYADADGKCEICKKEVAHILAGVGRTEKACVDHCHKTLVIRGILCHHCNRQLTFVEEHQAAIAEYLNPTADEKRLARNAKARKARATKELT